MIYLINGTQKNNSWFGDFVDRIYTTELEIKNTPDTDRSASYLLRVSILHFYDFGIVPTVWYFCFFLLFYIFIKRT
jgi:hypothetical protein